MVKRKRGSTSKLRGQNGPPPSKHPRLDPDKEYEVDAIIAESQYQYLIRWAEDKNTGETFDDSWEPKRNANNEAVDDWHARKEDTMTVKNECHSDLLGPEPSLPSWQREGRCRLSLPSWQSSKSPRSSDYSPSSGSEWTPSPSSAPSPQPSSLVLAIMKRESSPEQVIHLDTLSGYSSIADSPRKRSKEREQSELRRTNEPRKILEDVSDIADSVTATGRGNSHEVIEEGESEIFVRLSFDKSITKTRTRAREQEMESRKPLSCTSPEYRTRFELLSCSLAPSIWHEWLVQESRPLYQTKLISTRMNHWSLIRTVDANKANLLTSMTTGQLISNIAAAGYLQAFENSGEQVWFRAYESANLKDLVSSLMYWKKRRDGLDQHDFWREGSDAIHESYLRVTACHESAVDAAYSTIVQAIESEPKYTCAECWSDFTRKADVLRHDKTHNDARPFACDKCERRYKYKSDLTRHEREHGGKARVKQWKCLECGKFFEYRSRLEKHNRKHTGEKPFKCEYDGCGKAFAKQEYLTIHTRTHTGEKPYKCGHDGCGKEFTLQGNYAKHTRTHTGEKRYKCEVSLKRFSKRGNLETHKRQHTGTKPFICSNCGKPFADKTSLKWHCRKRKGCTRSLVIS